MTDPTITITCPLIRYTGPDELAAISGFANSHWSNIVVRRAATSANQIEVLWMKNNGDWTTRTMSPGAALLSVDGEWPIVIPGEVVVGVYQ